MSVLQRVQLQAEMDAPRAVVFELVSTSTGLRRWLDDADLEPRVGSGVHVRLAAARATGKVLSVAPPQHISYSWSWESEPDVRPGVVAFDLLDHGGRTHVTLRHVGLGGGERVRQHEDLWRYWFPRLLVAARSAGTMGEGHR